MLASFVEFSGGHIMPQKGLLSSELCNYSGQEYILLHIPTVLES